MKRLNRLIRWLGFGLLVAAVATELAKPSDEREWHGQLGGIVPYDLRPPTPARLKAAWWAPDDPRLFTGRAFGVGWAVNLARVVDLVGQARDRAPSRSA